MNTISQDGVWDTRERIFVVQLLLEFHTYWNENFPAKLLIVICQCGTHSSTFMLRKLALWFDIKNMSMEWAGASILLEPELYPNLKVFHMDSRFTMIYPHRISSLWAITTRIFFVLTMRIWQSQELHRVVVQDPQAISIKLTNCTRSQQDIGHKIPQSLDKFLWIKFSMRRKSDCSHYSPTVF